MTTYSNTPAPEGEKPPSFGIGKFLFVVVLAVILFLLGQGMVRQIAARTGGYRFLDVKSSCEQSHLRQVAQNVRFFSRGMLGHVHALRDSVQ